MELTKPYIVKEGQKIENFLEHSFESVEVEHVNSDFVTSRTTVGFNAEKRSEKYQVYYRIKVNSESEEDILETRTEMVDFFRDQLLEMERKSKAPDTMLVETDFPPSNINKPLVFFVISTL
jgi:hypothetical protein